MKRIYEHAHEWNSFASRRKLLYRFSGLLKNNSKALIVQHIHTKCTQFIIQKYLIFFSNLWDKIRSQIMHKKFFNKV